MSRIIKFRIWNKDGGYYLDAFTPKFGWMLSQRMTGANELVGFSRDEFDDKIILEQFTGILDKNGKEISFSAASTSRPLAHSNSSSDSFNILRIRLSNPEFYKCIIDCSSVNIPFVCNILKWFINFFSASSTCCR